MILPSVLPSAPCKCRWGSTDLSRLNGTGSLPPRAMSYPTRNFARLLLEVSQEAGLYLDRPRFIVPAMARIISTPDWDK